ncbi:MAG: Futalosine hydrolase [Gammaproteobacteria bacterium]|nr:Futalosine hydrolase [Gammaproteobacteria bacterium]
MINMVVALAVESRPLIRHFNLSEDRSIAGFRVFQDGRIRLIVTGTGRGSCAAGVAALGERGAARDVSAWLNVGIAGHAAHEVGAGVYAVSVLEAATDRRWYPAQIVPLPGRGEAFCTVDVPEVAYPKPYVYDMEASAFCATALRYATSELVQVYKVISDNRVTGVTTINKHMVRDLIAQHAPVIEEAVTGLSELAAGTNARLDRVYRRPRDSEKRST